MARLQVIAGLDPKHYARHALHDEARVWVEKNCYIDIWIELLHALRLDPTAMLAFTVAIDFEGDQWTFFKPSHTQIWDLYGLDVQELNVWRPLVEHALEHLGAGKLISTEADAWWLPDTAGTDYRSTHTKTTIVLNDIDLDARRLGYFHNAGYYQLEGEDFNRLFRLEAPADPAFMPLFAELVRIDRLRRDTPAELQIRATGLLAAAVQRLPADNPVARFAQRFQQQFAQLRSGGLPHYHAWAFAATRQLGAAFELAACHLQWLRGLPAAPAAEAVAACAQIATLAKTLILKGARSVNSGKAASCDELFHELASAWERAAAALRAVAAAAA